MSFMICFGDCIHCHHTFAFNPERVPAIVVNGTREPVCRTCMEWANARRIELGLQPFPILPGAYDETEVD